MPYVRKTKKTYRRKARPSRKISTKVKSYVKSTIARQTETKISPAASISNFQFESYDTLLNVAGQVVSLTDCLDLITQGTGQANRVGNHINLKKLNVKFIFSPIYPGTSYEDRNKTIKLIFFRVKKSLLEPTTAQWDQLLQNGNDNVPPSNQYLDIMRPLNRDLFDIKKVITFRLNKAETASIQTQMRGHSFIKTVNIDIAKYLPKKIIYDDNFTKPTNCRLFAGILVADSLGAPIAVEPGLTGSYLVQTSFLSYATYTD